MIWTCSSDLNEADNMQGDKNGFANRHWFSNI